MSTYEVTFISVASTMITVEADSEEDAVDKAYDKTPSICAQCGGWGKDAGIEIGDWYEDDDVNAGPSAVKVSE